MQNLLEKAGSGLGVSDGAGEPLIELVVTEPLPMPKGQPLVKDWDCLRVRVDWDTHKSLHLQSMCLLLLVWLVPLCSPQSVRHELPESRHRPTSICWKVQARVWHVVLFGVVL